jgi:hypothetical protein
MPRRSVVQANLEHCTLHVPPRVDVQFLQALHGRLEQLSFARRYLQRTPRFFSSSSFNYSSITRASLSSSRSLLPLVAQCCRRPYARMQPGPHHLPGFLFELPPVHEECTNSKRGEANSPMKNFSRNCISLLSPPNSPVPHMHDTESDAQTNTHEKEHAK